MRSFNANSVSVLEEIKVKRKSVNQSETIADSLEEAETYISRKRCVPPLNYAAHGESFVSSRNFDEPVAEIEISDDESSDESGFEDSELANLSDELEVNETQAEETSSGDEIVSFVSIADAQSHAATSMLSLAVFMDRAVVFLSFSLRLTLHRPIKRQKLVQECVKPMWLKMR